MGIIIRVCLEPTVFEEKWNIYHAAVKWNLIYACSSEELSLFSRLYDKQGTCSDPEPLGIWTIDENIERDR